MVGQTKKNHPAHVPLQSRTCGVVADVIWQLHFTLSAHQRASCDANSTKKSDPRTEIGGFIISSIHSHSWQTFRGFQYCTMLPADLPAVRILLFYIYLLLTSVILQASVHTTCCLRQLCVVGFFRLVFSATSIIQPCLQKP